MLKGGVAQEGNVGGVVWERWWCGVEGRGGMEGVVQKGGEVHVRDVSVYENINV